MYLRKRSGDNSHHIHITLTAYALYMFSSYTNYSGLLKDSVQLNKKIINDFSFFPYKVSESTQSTFFYVQAVKV